MARHLGPRPILTGVGESTEAPQTPEKIEPPQPGAGASLTTLARQTRFLQAYKNSRNVRASCLAAGIDRSTFYKWHKVAKFRARVAEADQDYLDILRAELDQRSKASDQVLIFRAKSLLSEFKDTLRTEHVVPDHGLPIRFTLIIGEASEEEEPQTPPASTNGTVAATNGHPAA